MKAEVQHHRKLSQIDVDNDPSEPLTNPSEINIKRIIKRNKEQIEIAVNF